MAQQQNKQNRPKQPQDPYAQKAKQLGSAVQRLRGWVGSDPSRTPELADALVALTEHRLLGHAYTVAAPEAQEAVKLAAQLLTANGPIGPYTSVADAARYVTAVVHLGVIQAAAGLPEAAADTIRSFTELREQLGSLPLAEALSPSTVVWALACTARGALAGGDVPLANAYADAALQRVAEAGLRANADAAYVVVDADRLVSDARWAAGLGDDALTHLQVARETYDRVVDGRLAQPGRLSPALLQRLSEPLFVIYRDLADRLLAGGEVDLSLVTRRQLVDLLAGIAPKDETARVQLAGSLADLVRDLRSLDRTEEADLVAEQLAARPAPERKAAGELSAGLARGSGDVRWEPLSAEAAYAASTAASGGGGVSAAEEEATLQRQAADRLAAERREAHRLEQERLEEARREAARRESERAEADRRAAEQAEAERAAAARRELERIEAERVERERLAAEEEAERRERQRRREERIEAHRREEERLEAERVEAERAAFAQREAERRATDPAEIERLELERLQAELAELERAEAEERGATAAAIAGDADAERAEAERAEAARVAQEQAHAEWLEGERRAREQAARDEADRARAAQENQDRIEREREEEAARAEAEWLAEQERAREDESAFERVESEAGLSERESADDRETLPAEPEDTELTTEPVQVQPAEAQTIEPAPVADQPVEVAPQPTQRVEPAPAEAEPVVAGALPDPTVAQPPAEPEPEPELEIEPVEDELDVTYRRWQDARSRGDRKEARALNEQVVELLRPRAEQDPAEHGPRLLYALEELSSARLRGGDLWGSRAPAKEAKALAKSLGRR